MKVMWLYIGRMDLMGVPKEKKTKGRTFPGTSDYHVAFGYHVPSSYPPWYRFSSNYFHVQVATIISH